MRGWLLLLVALLLPCQAMAAEIEVLKATARKVDDGWRLDARIHYRLSGEAREALENGVPLTFAVTAEVRPEGAWFWTPALVRHKWRYTIRYRPLSEIYQVVGLDTGTSGNYATREVALEALGRLRGVPLAKAGELPPGRRYRLWLKVALEKDALPLLLRPIAYLKPAWYLSSDWSQWPLNP